MKVCTACGVEKSVGEFPTTYNKTRGKSYPTGKCRPCLLAYRRTRERSQNSAAKREKYATPEGRRTILSQGHKWRYGITLDEKDALLDSQGGRCAICGAAEPGGHGWATDHDHACCPGLRSCGGCVRGVLCTRCNFALGHFDDDTGKLRAAIEYLEHNRLAGLTSGGNPNLSSMVSRRIPA